MRSLPSKKKEKHSDNWVDILSVPKWPPHPVWGHVDSESSFSVATGCDSTFSPDSALRTPVPCWKAACSVLSAVVEIQILKTRWKPSFACLAPCSGDSLGWYAGCRPQASLPLLLSLTPT